MRLSLKLLLISEAVLLIAVLVLVLPFWLSSRRQIIESMQNELKAIASTAALKIDGDVHEQVREPADAGSDAFRTIREQLEQVQQANRVQYDHLYTFYRDGDVMRFAVMLHPDPFVGDPYPIQPLMRPVLNEGTMEATELYADEHGRWISAYAPIRDAAGEIVGLLEVDKNSRMYLAAFYNYTLFTVGLGALALAISSMLGWLVLQRLVIQPMSAVHNGMRALARQDFSHRVDVSTRDEFEELADTFNGLSRQLNAARLIQSSFFPRSLPESTHYRLAGFSLPCDATGGDYFDAFELDDGRLAVVLADVSGHGLGPSLLMASCRAALRALAHAGLEPADLLDRLNALLLHDLDGGRFITMIYGELESDGTFTYANAGHGPALVARRSQVTHLASHRPPLGIQLDLNGEERQTTLQLEPEDRILLTSDGLSEAAGSDGEHFGLQRIEAVLADSDLDAYQVVEQLRQKLLDHTGDRPTLDDVTILCVDRNGEPSVTSGSV